MRFQLRTCDNTNNNENSEYSFEYLETETLGVEDIEISNLIIFPNPTNSVLNIRNHFGKSSQIIVHDFMDKLIQKTTSNEDLTKIN